MVNILGKVSDEFNNGVVYVENGVVILEATIKMPIFNKKKTYEDFFFKKEFENLENVMGYLRDIRYDCALNFELKDLVEPMLSSIYLNKNNKINLGV